MPTSHVSLYHHQLFTAHLVDSRPRPFSFQLNISHLPTWHLLSRHMELIVGIIWLLCLYSCCCFLYLQWSLFSPTGLIICSSPYWPELALALPLMLVLSPLLLPDYIYNWFAHLSSSLNYMLLEGRGLTAFCRRSGSNTSEHRTLSLRGSVTGAEHRLWSWNAWTCNLAPHLPAVYLLGKLLILSESISSFLKWGE